MGMEALAARYTGAQAALQAFLAGNTIILCPLEVPEAIKAIKDYIDEHPEYLTLLDANVLKILRAKELLGINNNRFVLEKNIHEKLHTPEAYALKKQLFSEAITIVHGEKFLPTNTAYSVLLLINPPADTPFAHTLDIPVITIDNNSNIPSVLEALNSYTTIIIGIYRINKREPPTYGISQTTKTLYEKLNNKHRIVVLFGTPYAASQFAGSDVLLVAYEQDSDAQQAAANVILGFKKAQGTLPVSLTLSRGLPQ